jgi:hypothetical protein
LGLRPRVPVRMAGAATYERRQFVLILTSPNPEPRFSRPRMRVQNRLTECSRASQLAVRNCESQAAITPRSKAFHWN